MFSIIELKLKTGRAAQSKSPKPQDTVLWKQSLAAVENTGKIHGLAGQHGPPLSYTKHSDVGEASLQCSWCHQKLRSQYLKVYLKLYLKVYLKVTLTSYFFSFS